MIPEAPYLFASAALSLSVGSLAGLVWAFRRVGEWAAHDFFRLRQIVEFGFANALLAMALLPLMAVTGDLAASVRVASAVALLYTVSSILIHRRRITRARVAIGRGLYAAIGLFDLVLIAVAVVGIGVGTIGAYQGLLFLGLVRPMFSFTLVLRTIDHE